MILRELKDVFGGSIDVTEVVIKGNIEEGVEFYFTFQDSPKAKAVNSFKRDENFDEYEVKCFEIWNFGQLKKVTLEIELVKGE